MPSFHFFMARLLTHPDSVKQGDIPGEPGVQRLLIALATLAVAGVSVDTTALFEGRNAELVSVDAAPRRAGWIVDGHTVRTADGAYLPGGLRPARQRNLTPAAVPTMVPLALDEPRETMVLEFLRPSRELIASQREVVLGYLGSEPAANGPLPRRSATSESDSMRGVEGS